MNMENFIEQFTEKITASINPSAILCSYYNGLLTDFESLQSILDEKKGEIKEKLAKLGCKNGEETAREMNGGLEGYDASWPWATKMEFLMKKFRKPLSTKELALEIADIEHRDPKEVKRIQSSLSATLSQRKRDIFKKSADGRYMLKATA